jgi:hypothetical protein
LGNTGLRRHFLLLPAGCDASPSPGPAIEESSHIFDPEQATSDHLTVYSSSSHIGWLN